MRKSGPWGFSQSDRLLAGFATCARLKAQPIWRGIPVRLMTSLDEPEQKVRAFAVGAVDNILNPFKEAEVLFRIAQGKRNPDIAPILGAGLRTLHNYVENTSRKLGCETRAAAVTAQEQLCSGRQS